MGALLLVGMAIVLIGQGGTFQPPTISNTTPSGKALHAIQAELPPRAASFGLIFSHPAMAAKDPVFAAEVRRVLAPLRADRRVARVISGYDAPSPNPRAFSRDGRRMQVTVELAGHRASDAAPIEFLSPAGETYAALRTLVHSDVLEVLPTGAVALQHDFDQALKHDLRRIELLVLPVVLVLLVLVFGSLVAALLPLVVGVLAVTAGLAGAGLLARVTPISTYATNVMTMIGLGVAIDYSLFIVSRFREEVRDCAVPEALARTLATAGHAVVFAGATVAVGLLGLAFLSIGGLGSLGVAGTIVVTFAVLYAVTFLPAVLSILGRHIDAGRLPGLGVTLTRVSEGFWPRLAGFVMAHPWPVLIGVTAFLLVLGTPFLDIRMESGDISVLPQEAEARRGEELLRREFAGADVNPIIVVVRYPDDSPLRRDRIDRLFDLSRWLAARHGVLRVDSPLDLDPSISRAQYHQLFTAPPSAVSESVARALRQMVGKHVVLFTASTALRAEEARALVRTIRAEHPPVDGEVLVSGRTAFDLDFIDVVVRDAVVVIGFVVLVTYAVLLVLLGSVLLPLKAVVMNFLSITASYGALVWIFQEGHLASWLNFTPRPIEIPTPLVMFCVLFGLSMDYEVLLLSRIREEYRRTDNNEHAVSYGLQHTGRLITGAAAIMAGVFFGFGLARVVVVKAIGVAMGIAVLIDATVVRALLVPATMRLLGRWNWWAPAGVRRFYRRFRASTTR